MIDRVVLYKLRDELTTDEARAEIAAHARVALRSLPGVRDLRVGVPADEASAKSWDLSLVLRFDTLDDLEPYRTDAAHQAFVAYMAERAVVSKRWNFAVD
ncbi:MAG: Dabb family protein [Myxococcales bacterium]|nr:Dabb family protein [Myxococcales bacterium]